MEPQRFYKIDLGRGISYNGYYVPQTGESVAPSPAGAVSQYVLRCVGHNRVVGSHILADLRAEGDLSRFATHMQAPSESDEIIAAMEAHRQAEKSKPKQLTLF